MTSPRQMNPLGRCISLSQIIWYLRKVWLINNKECQEGKNIKDGQSQEKCVLKFEH